MKDMLGHIGENTHVMLCDKLCSMKACLQQARSMNLGDWLKKYQLAMRHDRLVTFAHRDIYRARERGAKIMVHPNMTNNLTVPLKYTALSIDPATDGKQSAYTAFLVIGYGTDGHRYLLWLERGKYPTPYIKRHIIDLWLAYSCDHVIVESNNYQKSIIQELRAERHLFRDRQIDNTMNVVASFTGINKHHPEFGIVSLVNLLEADMVTIPWGVGFTRTMFGTLITELKKYPGRTTDCVMAWWINEFYMRKYFGRSSTHQPMNTIRHDAPEVQPEDLEDSPIRTIIGKLNTEINYAKEAPRNLWSNRKELSAPSDGFIQLPYR
jgi:hypothetical protein